MSAHDLSLRLANRPLMRALQERRQPAPVYETVLVEPDEDRMVRLLLALAPMAFAFFYLAFVSLFLFH